MTQERWRKAIVLCLLFPLLSACWSAREMEHMFYAHAVGVDYVQGHYKIYVQILDFSRLGRAESAGVGNQTQEGVWVGLGQGPSIQWAIHDLYASSQRRIYWGHLNTVVFSDNLLKLGIHESMEILTRFNEFRYTLWVFGSRDPVKQVLLASPVLEASPVFSLLGDPTDIYRQSSFIRPIRINRLISRIREPGKTALLPMVRLSKGHWSDMEHQFTSLQMEGLAALKDGKWNGFFDVFDLTGIRWVEQQTVRTPLMIDSYLGSAATMIFRNPKVRIQPHLRDGKARFTVKIKVEGLVSELKKPVSEAKLAAMSEKLIREQIMATYHKGLKQKVDLLNLLDAMYRKKYRDWRKLSRMREFPLDEHSLQSVEVKVRIRSSGRSLRPFLESTHAEGQGI